MIDLFDQQKDELGRFACFGFGYMSAYARGLPAGCGHGQELFARTLEHPGRCWVFSFDHVKAGVRELTPEEVASLGPPLPSSDGPTQNIQNMTPTTREAFERMALQEAKDIEPRPGSCEACDSCGVIYEKKKLSYCKRCRTAQYCSAECQKQHWKTHKARCASIQQLKSGMHRAVQEQSHSKAQPQGSVDSP